LKTLPLSMLISAWLTFVTKYPGAFHIPLDDQHKLSIIRDLTAFLPFLPPDLAVYFMLTLIVFIILLPF